MRRYGDLGYDSFLAAYDDLGVNLSQTFEEKFRVYKRECFNQGVCKKRKGVQRSIERTANQWDLDEVCPDSIQAWDKFAPTRLSPLFGFSLID